jgi:hypothetical protein
VFAEEIGTAARAVGTKFSTTKRSLLLVNDRRDDEKYPLATVSALRHALLATGRAHEQGRGRVVPRVVVARIRGRHRLGEQRVDDVLARPRRRRVARHARRVRHPLARDRDLGLLSGSFIEALRDDRTIVITAASADRTSFGCSDDRDLTEFGAAFYRDALPGAPNLRAAFEATRKLVAEREQAEQREASDPQAWFGPLIEAKLATAVP